MPHTSSEPPHILVVDDDARLRALLGQYLGEQGWIITQAEDAAAARARLAMFTVDLIVLDVMMPGETGLELAADLRKEIMTPILMLTAINSKFPMGFSEKDIDKEWLPVSDFVEKPVDLNVLKDKVHALLNPVGV